MSDLGQGPRRICVPGPRRSLTSGRKGSGASETSTGPRRRKTTWGEQVAGGGPRLRRVVSRDDGDGRCRADTLGAGTCQQVLGELFLSRERLRGPPLPGWRFLDGGPHGPASLRGSQAAHSQAGAAAAAGTQTRAPRATGLPSPGTLPTGSWDSLELFSAPNVQVTTATATTEGTRRAVRLIRAPGARLLGGCGREPQFQRSHGDLRAWMGPPTLRVPPQGTERPGLTPLHKLKQRPEPARWAQLRFHKPQGGPAVLSRGHSGQPGVIFAPFPPPDTWKFLET